MLGLSMCIVCTIKGALYLLKYFTESIHLNGLPPDVKLAQFQNDYNIYAFNEPLFYQNNYNEVSSRIKLDDYMVPQTFEICS